MTVTSSTARIRYSGNGATVAFSTSFAFLANTHVRVIHTTSAGVSSDWVENTHYTLTGADTGAAGTVTVKTTPTDYTPATGEYLTIIRNVPFTQTLDGTILGTMAAGDLEDALDKIWQGLGQVNEKLARAVVGSETGDGTAADSITAWTPEFAIATDGARRVLQVVAWSGGSGTEPALGYVGSTGIVAAVGDGIDIRGATGAAGAGAGDMIAANNLSDVASAATSRTNLGLGTAATTAASDYATAARTISAGGIATGGGSLAADRTITVTKATGAEVTTGTEDAKAVTPKALADAGVVASNTPAGRIRLGYFTTAASGWLLMDDGTIGNAASGGTSRANADTSDLYAAIWGSTADAECAVSTGRGASAAADFAANKTIALPKVRGRALGVYGAGSGLTARVMAKIVGEETHTPTLAEMYAHTHTGGMSGGGTQVGGSLADGNSTSPATSSVATGSVGSSTPFNVMSPTSFLNAEIKL